MLDVKYNIKSLISSIYECQKKIIINRRFIRELESEGNDTNKLRGEISDLERKISEFQKELRKRYQFSLQLRFKLHAITKNHSLQEWFLILRPFMLIEFCFNKPPVVQGEADHNGIVSFPYQSVGDGTSYSAIVGNIHSSFILHKRDAKSKRKAVFIN